jgi:hypothetical protein
MNEITKAYFEKLDNTALRVADPTGMSDKTLKIFLTVALLEFMSFDFLFEKGQEPRVMQDQ